MNTPLDTKAIRAVATTGSPGEWLIAAPSLLLTLCDELDELRATLANERGEGEPPGEGWEPCLEGERHDNPDGSEDIVTRWFKPLPGLWLYAGTSAAEHGWWWSVLGRTSEGRRVCMARGNAPTAREAMRAAMTAADKTRSPA